MRLLSWGFLILFVVIGARLVKVHTDPDMKLTAEEKGHVGATELRIPRGEIRDRNNGLLAKDRLAYSLWANPRKIADAEMTAMVLAAQFGLNEGDLRAWLAKRDENNQARKFVWIKRWLSDQDLRAFENLDPMIKWGLELKSESVRCYPDGEIGTHAVGVVDVDGRGRSGVELSFDQYLRSVPGRQKSRVDARRIILRSLTFEYVEPEGGDTVYLTLDRTVQRKLEVEIDKAMAAAQAPQGMGIVMDPRTGAILALACRPAYDPNVRGDLNDEIYRNRAVEYAFEPGSSFKIVTAAAALDQHLITTETLIDCKHGRYVPCGRHVIGDYHPMGVEPFRKCFEQSSNIAIIQVGALLGPEHLEYWIRRFGFGGRACMDFTVETAGIFRDRMKSDRSPGWTSFSMASLPMGQEVAVTVPQLARAFAVIANGGWVVEPYLVERAVDRDGEVTYQHEGKPPDRIISEETAAIMRDLCHRVVLNGTGKPGSIPEYRVGGKTGTAQIAKKQGKGFSTDKFTAIFAGFAPLAAPRVVAVIIVQEPAVKLHFGGTICGPVFREVVRDTLIRMNCPPDPVTEDVEDAEPPAEDDDTVVARTENNEEVPAPENPGAAIQAAEQLAANAPVPPEEPLLPSFQGLTKRQAKEQADALGIRWNPQGAGRVVSQDPPAGTPVRDVPVCHLMFSNDVLGQDHEVESAASVARM
jgi:cell division protein FtsI/penicillin-binding protein 2